MTSQSTVPEVADPEATEPPAAAARRRRFRYTLPGAWVALAFTCMAFTPSLLPRGPLAQGIICGITAAIGYACGVVGAWVWRAVADREVRPASRTSWLVFACVAVPSAIVAYLGGRYWQGAIRDLMDASPPSVLSHFLLPVVAAVVFVLLVALARGLHRLYLLLAGLLNRWIGRRAALGLAWVAVVGGTYLVVSGVLLDGLASLANRSFALQNNITQEGVTQPTSALRSGGPQSLVSWDSLGREGRTFMSGGPTAAQISAFSGTPATEPIRAYAGLDSADDSEERAALAVKDLERAGGFERDYLMVATTTGSGWVSPGGADSFEYMVNGNSAVVAIQYSYLPSWISYLVDQKEAREAGRDLFDAVYERWLTLPQESRPKLIGFGESLGSFGAEAAFSGEIDMSNRTDGALLTGPPNFNPLYREFVDDRDPGTTEVQPTYRDGRSVRFYGNDEGVIPPVGQQWDRNRILYVQHPSDPIVWWSPNLILKEPDWLKEPRGYDVLPDMHWAPFVTFWQVTMDLPGATAVPGGHGHVYTPNYVDGWVNVLQPAGWTAAKSEALQKIIVGE